MEVRAREGVEGGVLPLVMRQLAGSARIRGVATLPEDVPKHHVLGAARMKIFLGKKVASQRGGEPQRRQVARIGDFAPVPFDLTVAADGELIVGKERQIGEDRLRFPECRELRLRPAHFLTRRFGATRLHHESPLHALLRLP